MLGHQCHVPCRAGEWVCFTRLDQVAAFLETGLLVATADKAGKRYPWHSWENILTLKKSWDTLTFEKKQTSPSLVAAATSPAGTQITTSRVQRPRNQMLHVPDTLGWKSQRGTPPKVALGHPVFSQCPRGPGLHSRWLWSLAPYTCS